MIHEVHGEQVEIDDNRVKESREELRAQLEQYLNGDRKDFELEIVFPDNFTGELMEQLLGIPYGETVTYAELADKMDTAPIAVGRACASNPLPVIVACHRVVANDGLGGYQYGELKQRLLELERDNLTP